MTSYAGIVSRVKSISHLESFCRLIRKLLSAPSKKDDFGSGLGYTMTKGRTTWCTISVAKL